MRLEFWRGGGVNTTATLEGARTIEAEGWDGQMFMDSQSLGADPFVQMGVWAAATESLKLATGVTNPHTRHLAVLACAAATIQSISGGRAVLGIGRGDSALAYLGRAPVSVDTFMSSLETLQGLLRGEELLFAGGGVGSAYDLDTISMGVRPEGMALRWLPTGLPKVPMDVAATGPKVIARSASIAERLTFSVGAAPERVSWALDVARGARAERGLTDDGISFGAQVIVICHTDPEAALERAVSFSAPLARFQVIQGPAAGPQDVVDTENFAAIRRSYDMTKHGSIAESKRLIGDTISPQFAKRFTIVGPPDHCIERLLDLVKLGLDRFHIVGPGFYPEDWGEARNLFAREVMPTLRVHAADLQAM